MGRFGAIFAGIFCASLVLAATGCVAEEVTDGRGISSGGSVGEPEQEPDGDSQDDDAGADVDAGPDTQATDPDTVIDDGSACAPADWTCESGVQQFCEDTLSTSARSCADSCGTDAHCSGDTCADAIDVDLSAGAARLLEGENYAYSDEWNADGRANCMLDGTGSGGSTTDADVYLRIHGHATGETIVLSAEHSETPFGFYVLSACGAAGCLDAGAAEGPLAPNRFSWRATTSDPVVVIAETLGSHRDRTFEISISRQ